MIALIIALVSLVVSLAAVAFQVYVAWENATLDERVKREFQKMKDKK